MRKVVAVRLWRVSVFLLAFEAALIDAAHAAPACVLPDAKNVVVANVSGNLSDGWGGSLLLQSVNSHERILMRRCSREVGSQCYFAVDVRPGRYYFGEVLTGASNGFVYPVSKAGLWFDITGKGVDYIGDWTIERGDQRVVQRLQIRYELSRLDEMLRLCEISGKKLFLSKTREKAAEIVD